MTTDHAAHESRRPGGRYSSVSIGLHWLIAALLITQVFVGGWFSDLERGAVKREAFQLHLSIGVTILTLSLVRLGWRIAHPAPPLPDSYSRPVRILARTTHVGFYMVLIGMPLSGWAIVSGHGARPLPEVWGVLPWPRLPGVGHAAHEAAQTIHTEIILKAFWVLLFLHVAGALKHQFLDKDNTLWRMLPLVGRRSTAG